MSSESPSGDAPATAAPDPDEPRPRAFNEDWAAVVVGLALLALVLIGAIPEGVIP
ncbi:hypothetical protein ACFQS3_01320 [Glycomyces mayteni]|uniref:Uncharacterized protein n=1 Tax=Glycomyces mayteni TaxID=543887 RepID=A0ABW2D0S0_9ACTN|nr:hypothetical protein GCM10025732_45230 [Glycomyces mayteni]